MVAATTEEVILQELIVLTIIKHTKTQKTASIIAQNTTSHTEMEDAINNNGRPASLVSYN